MTKTDQPRQIGKYEVVRALGKGASATVYQARDPAEGRDVAIKLVRLDSDNKALARRLQKVFQTEISVARRLDHPNIVRVFDAVLEELQAYIVMEFVDGRPLDQFCRIDRLLPMDQVIGIIFKCCLALDHAFRRGVVHRDIKPANIMVDRDGNPKIMDFGLALFLQKDMEKDSTFVMGVGSPAYMSPEQIKGYPLNQKTDLYSLGVVLYQLLSGRLPFRAANHGSLIYKIINAEVPSITALNPQLPEALDAILKKALEKDLYARYKNGAEFGKDLTTVRFQMESENSIDQDLERFEAIRAVSFFHRFDDIELWETLRICTWRDVPPGVSLMTEGEEDRRFGVLVSGSMEVSIGGHRICRLGPGEVVGELTFLHPDRHIRQATVVTLEPSVYLEINPSALSLASEEVQERFNKTLIAVVVDRLRTADEVLATVGGQASPGSAGAGDAGLLTPPIDFV